MINRETERLKLRNLTINDLEDMLELSQQYEANEMAQYDQQYPQTVEGMNEVMEFLSTGDSFAAVELKSKQKFIGLLQIQRKKHFEDEVVHGLGYVFNSEYQGKGYASEACKEILAYLFEEMRIDKCTAGTAAVNVKSRKLLDKLGFKQVEQKKTHFRKDKDGNPIEFMYVIYDLTKEQWKKE